MKNIDVIEKIWEYAKKDGDRIAIKNPDCATGSLTYRELYVFAYKLAAYIEEKIRDSNPIVVYGHKNPYMIVSFLACIISGHTYCPVDISMPKDRIEMILHQTKSSIILATEDMKTDSDIIVNLTSIKDICATDVNIIPKLSNSRVNDDQTFYIIFTSGSTGEPKGVEITADNLSNFLEWSSTLGEEYAYGKDTVFLNQAPFSFDLSVMDLYTSLYCGSTLCLMEKKIQEDLGKITPFIKKNKISVLVATPSFANVCLVDKQFNGENLTSLKNFFFCGEILTNKTAAKILERFPDAVVHNTYGPTESTVAVSSIRITREILNKFDPLPVGYPKKNTGFIISEYGENQKNGERCGEILITGDTLAKGYFRQKELTEIKFTLYDVGTKKVRAYHTGDIGYIENGLLFYCGRIDLQVKLNGYRIEIGDIESCILKNKAVSECVVVPRVVGGKVKALIAVLVCRDSNVTEKHIKEELKNLIPAYMIPQNYVFVDAIPMTNNGKADRKRVAVMIEEE